MDTDVLVIVCTLAKASLEDEHTAQWGVATVHELGAGYGERRAQHGGDPRHDVLRRRLSIFTPRRRQQGALKSDGWKLDRRCRTEMLSSEL